MSAILYYLVRIVFGFIEIILGLRFLLRLLNANTSTPFVSWIYETSDPLLAPFRGMFPNPVVRPGAVIEINTLIALLAFALLAYLIEEFLAFIAYNANRHYRRRD